MASSRDWHGGKGSVRRPGKAYEDNYDAIFGKKAKNTVPQPEKALITDPDLQRFVMHMVASLCVLYVLAICILAII